MEVAQKDLRRVAACREKLDVAQHDLVESIVAARESGETLRDIANVAGLSHQRIHQILAERGIS